MAVLCINSTEQNTAYELLSVITNITQKPHLTNKPTLKNFINPKRKSAMNSTHGTFGVFLLQVPTFAKN